VPLVWKHLGDGLGRRAGPEARVGDAWGRVRGAVQVRGGKLERIEGTSDMSTRDGHVRWGGTRRGVAERVAESQNVSSWAGCAVPDSRCGHGAGTRRGMHGDGMGLWGV